MTARLRRRNGADAKSLHVDLEHTLHSERARVLREIVQYSTLTRAALQSTKTIAEKA